MNIVKPDELHRLVKLAMDTGEAESIEHAQRIFAGYRIGVAVGREIGRSNTHQAALLTFLRLASRVFLGGVDVLIPDQAVIPNLLPENQNILEAILAAGARQVKSLDPNVPAVSIGTVVLPQSARFAVRTVFNGWRAGILPMHAGIPFDLDSEFPLSGQRSIPVREAGHA